MKKNNRKKTRSTLPLIAYAKRTFVRYQGLRKKERSHFLDGVVKDFGGHRKAIIRLYSKFIQATKHVKHPSVQGDAMVLVKPRKKRGVKAKYDDPTLVWWLQTLWIAMNKVNEKLMHAMLPKWLEKSKDPSLPADVREKLLKISPASIERLIRSYKREHRKRLYCTTKPPRSKTLMIQIPVRALDFEAKTCGYIEGDTVAHCGTSLLGSFAWTLNTIDHKSHWTEQEAFLGNGGENVLAATIEMRKRYPFKIHSYHSDSGSEFINHHIAEYFLNPHDYVVQTRGRAYKKNDQARIEQRNWSHVRLIFGYERIDKQELINAMNDIYRNEWRLLNNFFTATRKQTLKVRVGAKFKRTFDKPKTPYQRVLDDPAISQIQKEHLIEHYNSLDPFVLKKSLDKKLKSFETMLKNYTIKSELDKKEAA